MCGIVGWVQTGETFDRRVIPLIRETNIRGLHSFGLSFYEGRKLITVKKNVGAFTDEELENLTRTKTFIYHCRYSTSGDYHSPINNQPLYGRGVSVALNGVISMKTREEMEREFSMRLHCDNDTEIFLNYWKDKGIDFIEGWLKTTTASVAAIITDDNKVYACRNLKRPLRYCVVSDGVVVASTADILRRAGFTEPIHNIPPYKVIEVSGLWTPN